jgi:hypothetical protein
MRAIAAKLTPAEIDGLATHYRAGFRYLEHDPEKWVPVFGKDHAPAIS